MSKRTLLAVLAHPDDESFGMGGTLAYYASQGVDVHLICATRGEAGEVAPEQLDGYNSIGELREAELRCAAGYLGLTSVHFLGYRDSGMPGSPDNRHPQALAAQPLDEVAAKVADTIARLDPQVVLTFDPIGGYRHPDHVAIHIATVRAFEMVATENPVAGDPDGYHSRGLYFLVFPKRLLRWTVRIMPLLGMNPHKFGSNGDIDIADYAAVEFPIHARIRVQSVLKKKELAASCHASQGGGQIRRSFLSVVMRRFGSTERFMRAYPTPRPGEKVTRDLFSPLRGN